MLCVVGDHSRDCLTLVADRSIGGHRLACEMDMLTLKRGKLHRIVSDNGPKMTLNAMLKW